MRIFRDTPDASPGRVLEAIDRGLRGTRGAAAGLARLDSTNARVTFAGVGNISAVVIGAAGTQSLVSHNGTLGHEAPRIQEFACPWPAGALLVLHSDGLRHHWRLDAYPGLSARHPSLIAAVLYRDFMRRQDDVTVVVARAPDPPAPG